VTWVFANDHDSAVAANHFALFANLFNAGVNLHVCCLFAVVVLAKCRESLLSSSQLLVAVDNATAREVVWAELYDDLVLREDSDVVLAHLA